MNSLRLEKLTAANVETFIEKAKRYTAIDELTPELLRLFIQRIEVGERSKKYSHSPNTKNSSDSIKPMVMVTNQRKEAFQEKQDRLLAFCLFGGEPDFIWPFSVPWAARAPDRT